MCVRIFRPRRDYRIRGVKGTFIPEGTTYSAKGSFISNGDYRIRMHETTGSTNARQETRQSRGRAGDAKDLSPPKWLLSPQCNQQAQAASGKQATASHKQARAAGGEHAQHHRDGRGQGRPSIKLMPHVCTTCVVEESLTIVVLSARTTCCMHTHFLHIFVFHCASIIATHSSALAYAGGELHFHQKTSR